MPGIRNMNSNGVNGVVGQRDGDGKKRTYDGKFVNGTRGTSAEEMPTRPPSTSVSDQVAQLPPELAHVAASSYHSFSKLLLRINQECYNDLNDLLHQMAGLPTDHQINGAMSNGYGNGGQDAESSKQKRLMMIKFAQDNRAKFIKMLVLADWGKKSAMDVAKVIDLFSWSREQSAEQDAADAQVEQLKLMSAMARQGNPDIRTALEILTTQKAGWLPDLGYIPPEPISSEKALSLLRYMDTSLCIRLTAHEKLPHHLQNWRVESGRAIFTISNEFEFDVVSLVEDTSDQWHFLDFRLLFSPAPVIDVDSRILFELKVLMDGNLAAEDKGLEECFKFLLNFTLTHKISVLRSQAHALLRAGWDSSLKVDSPHRQLVLSYWTDKPGKKSWIEIGISSNRPKNGKVSWRGPPIPSLTARWFRQGTEVKDVALKLDFNNLSAERIMKRVIALHVAHLLRTTRENMKLATNIQITLSESEPADCMLQASMGSSTNKVTLSVEPATGRYILQPVTSLSAAAENAINRAQDASTPSNVLTQLLARSLVDIVQRCTQQLGWQQVGRQTLRLEAVKAAVNLEVIQFALYRPRGWTSKWAVAAIVDASGESWWLCKINSTGISIENAQKLAMDKSNGYLDITRATLSSIARVAVNTLAFYVNIEALQKENKTFTVGYDFAQPRPNAASQKIVRGWVLHLKTSELLPSKPGTGPWLQPGMRIACHGLRLKSQKVWHIATGIMIPAVAADMKKLMASSPQTDFHFSDNGHFQILLNTPFGESVVDNLMTRLRDINRLQSFATILQRRKMLLQSSSLQQVKFQYSKSLSATVKFGEGEDIKVEFSKNNPHMRIQHFLENTINAKTFTTASLGSRADNAHLDRFCVNLMLTRPLLTAVDAIEASSTKTPGSPTFHAHSIGLYRMTYSNPICSFDICLKAKDDKVLWLIEDLDRHPTDLRTKDERTPGFTRLENLKTALRNLFRKQEERWYGVGTGIVAQVDGIPEALKQLHTTVMTCYLPGGVKQPVPLAVNNISTNTSNQAKAVSAAKPTGQAPAKPNGQVSANRPGGGGGVGGRGGPQRQPINKNNNNNNAGGGAKPKGKTEVITIDD